MSSVHINSYFVSDSLALLLAISIIGYKAGSIGEGKCSISTCPPFTTACSRLRKNVDDLHNDVFFFLGKCFKYQRKA